MENIQFSVSQISEYIKHIFDAEEILHNVNMYGEVSGSNISGGNIYFTIKDEISVMPCVVFGTHFKDIIKNGEKILLTGSPNYYVKGGKLSFIANKAVPFGKGILYQQFLELKARLEKEGLFDIARKKLIPRFIKKLGVVSSSTGAVIQDIINVTQRRNNSVDIILYPVKVQGVGAEESICEGINYFSKNQNVDVIIVARGGGSYEDLMTFNSENIARAVANSSIPVVSAVGHETDFTIIDFVSDLRAPTPSAAAEMLVLEKDKELNYFSRLYTKLIQVVQTNIDNKRNKLKDFINKFNSIMTILINKSQYELHNEKNRLILSYESFIKCKLQVINQLTIRLYANNPVTILEKGYAKISANDSVVTRASDLYPNEDVTIQFIDGIWLAKTTQKENKK